MGKIEKIEEIEVEKLVPYGNNAKIHGRKQLDKIKDSIREFGFLTPCLIDKDFNIIAGHGRVMAAKEMQLKKVPCVFIEGLSELQRKAYILADNRLSELGEWDMELVAAELKELADDGFGIELTGFSIDDSIFDNEKIDDSNLNKQIDDFLNESDSTRTAQGDIWELGQHRLMVGDSKEIEQVLDLLGGVRLTYLKLTHLIMSMFNLKMA